MQRSRSALLLLGTLALTAFAVRTTPAARATTEPPDAPVKLKVGDVAPDFELFAFDGKKLKKFALHDYRGKKNVALAFYVFAFTGG